MISSRETVKIRSIEHNVLLDVWFYRPEGPGPYPVVVAGHGVTLVKEAGLAAFGERWAKEAGYASLIMDYRGFGDSGGFPRNLVVVEKELQDYRSVIEWARARPETFRSDKIVVMGSALSGLIVSDLLVHDSNLAGGMVHAPVLDGYLTLSAGTPNPRLLFWAAVDYVRGKLGLSPIYVKAIGRPDEFAFLNTPSCYSGFSSMYENAPKSFAQVDNLIAPRLAFEMLSWRPPLKDAKSPLLIVAADSDDLIPLRVIEQIVNDSNGKVRLEVFSGEHFDVMEGGKGFDRNVKEQIDFLRNLL